jgi:hypothetical protein
MSEALDNLAPVAEAAKAFVAAYDNAVEVAAEAAVAENEAVVSLAALEQAINNYRQSQTVP